MKVLVDYEVELHIIEDQRWVSNSRWDDVEKAKALRDSFKKDMPMNLFDDARVVKVTTTTEKEVIE